MRWFMLVTVMLLCAVGGITLTVLPNSTEKQVRLTATPIVKCDVDAYVIDQDPQGLNVRSGPGKDHAVVSNLPRKEDTGVAVHITGASGNWVRIDLAFEEGTDDEANLFKGVGWVYGPLLGLSGIALQKGGTPLYRDSSTKTQLVVRVPGGEDVSVKGCRGKWLLVEYKNVTGWAAPQTLCANSLTTCV
jgi:uncharacterized protein YraI